MSTAPERLAALRELQARFVEAVQSARFDEARALESQRRALIEPLLRSNPGADTLRELAAIAAADRALLPPLEAAQARCDAELRTLKRSRHAASAYAAS